MIKNMIFDFDGVLVDSEILVARAMKKYLNPTEQKMYFQKSMIIILKFTLTR